MQPSYLPALPVSRELGHGYLVVCPECQTQVVSSRRGLCPDCGVDLALPSLASRRDRLPARLQNLLQRLEPVEKSLGEWFRHSPWLFVFFWGGLLTGSAPFSMNFFTLLFWGHLVDRWFPSRLRDPEPIRRLRLPAPAKQELPPGATPRPRLTDLFSARVDLENSWWQVNQIRRRRGISVHLDTRIQGLQGHPLELELRFLGPDGRYARAALSHYRGSRGEAMANHRTRPLRHDDSRFPDLWIYLPLRALGLPRGLVRLEGTAEITLSTPQETLLRHYLPVDLIPLEEDLWIPQGGQSSEAEGLLLLSVQEASQVACGVCGDPVEETPIACGVCGAPHHPECWAYLDGCSRFGCPESPGRRQNSGS